MDLSTYFKDLIDRATSATEFTKGKTNALLKKWTFDLSAAGEQTINLQGNFVYGYEATDGAANVDIQFSRKDSAADYFNITKAVGFTHPFDKLHVSWEAQGSKTLTLYIANLAPELFGVTDNRSALLTAALLQSILDELTGTVTAGNFALQALGAGATQIIAANTARKSCIVHNPLGNAVIYLGYANTVTAIKYFVALQGGESWSTDDYLGAVWAIGTAAQNVAYGEQV